MSIPVLSLVEGRLRDPSALRDYLKTLGNVQDFD